jgi:class III poly(R)-hydroxyalkanoic acid synthase PhaE subunit
MQNFNSQLGVNMSGNPIDSLSVGSFWIKLNDLYWNLAYEKTLGSLTQIPALGPNRTFNIQSMRAVDAWVKLYPATVNYQIVLIEIQMQSFLELMGELNSLAERGESLKDWQQLQQLWSITADKVFERAFISEDNLKVRGKFLNAVNQYKLCQQELMELWMQVMNIPIRSEVDEVHKNIYELRKEVKRLKKTLA